MTLIVAPRIAGNIFVSGQTQGFTFNTGNGIGQYQLINSYVPTSLNPSQTGLEWINNNGAGFRYRQSTALGATSGQFIFEKFTSGAFPGTALHQYDASTNITTFLNPVTFSVAPTFSTIFDVQTPVNPNNPTTKAYVDGQVGNKTITLTGAVTGTSTTGTVATTLTNINTSQITNFASAVTAYRLDQLAAPTGPLVINTLQTVSPLTITPTGNLCALVLANSSLTQQAAFGYDSTANQVYIALSNSADCILQTTSGGFIFQIGTVNRVSITSTATTFSYSVIFNANVTVPNPTLGPQAVNKTYIDNLRLDQLVAPTAAINFNSQSINNAAVINGASANLGTAPGSPPSGGGKLLTWGGTQNISTEETAARFAGSMAYLKIELYNYAASGHNYEIRSSSQGVFDITDRTASATRLNINTNGYVAINPGSGSTASYLLDVFGTSRVIKLIGNTTSSLGIIYGPAAGSSPSSTITGCELSGTVTVNASTTISSGIVVTLVLSSGMPSANYGVVFVPANQATAAITATLWYTTDSTNQFSIRCSNSLTSATIYKWNYHIIGC